MTDDEDPLNDKISHPSIILILVYTAIVLAVFIPLAIYVL